MTLPNRSNLQFARDPEEQQRIRRIVEGDADAFANLIEDFHPMAFGLAYRILLHQEDAEEVVQDAFIKIHAAMRSFRGDSSLKTWILRIVFRLSLNRRRDRSRSTWYKLGLQHRNDKQYNAQEIETQIQQINPESECVSADDRRKILELIDELPGALREVLLLNSMEELSYEEISRVLDIPIGTVSSRIYSARRKLLPKFRRYELV
tara:strand:- start:1144 stop:1761 length:618 start_codon:yes stop_codon:yes gene_type:complete